MASFPYLNFESQLFVASEVVFRFKKPFIIKITINSTIIQFFFYAKWWLAVHRDKPHQIQESSTPHDICQSFAKTALWLFFSYFATIFILLFLFLVYCTGISVYQLHLVNKHSCCKHGKKYGQHKWNTYNNDTREWILWGALCTVLSKEAHCRKC